MNTCGDNGVLYWSTLCMFWHSTCGFQRWHWGNLCIGVDAHFRPCFFGRNLGALFEVLYVGLNIMNLKLFDAYRIIDPRILVVTLEYLGDIRVDWCVSYGVILLWTLGLLVTLIGIAQWFDRKITLRWFRTLQAILSYVLRDRNFGVTLCCMLRDCYMI